MRRVSFRATAPSLFSHEPTVLMEPIQRRSAIMAIVVTGATGNVGRPLVAELAGAGVEVRAVTRNRDAAGFPGNVAVVDSAATALPGASAVFLNSRALGEELATVVELARDAGGRRLARPPGSHHDEAFS